MMNSERDCKMMVSKKPPLPPKPPKRSKSADQRPTKATQSHHAQWKTDDENAQQIQKLVAMNEKSNLEISDMRKQLHHERSAVRELR